MKRMMGRREDASLLKVLTLLQKVDPKDVLKLIKKKEQREREQKGQSIPVSVFSCAPLSSLEAIVVYLRDSCQLKFAEMGCILGRNQIPLNRTYHQAKKKHKKTLLVKEAKYQIPCSIFLNKKLSVLENIVVYLKEEESLTNNNIAKLLKKDPRTVWTVLSRAAKKGVRI